MENPKQKETKNLEDLPIDVLWTPEGLPESTLASLQSNSLLRFDSPSDPSKPYLSLHSDLAPAIGCLAHSERLGSTQTTISSLSALLEGGKPVVLVADFQTAGLGTCGRSWSATDASLAFSVLFPGEGEFVALRAAFSVCRAVEACFGVPAQLKLPNDVLVGGKKISGALVQVAEGVCCLGVGVNLRPVGPFAGLEEFSQEKVPRSRLMKEILQTFFDVKIGQKEICLFLSPRIASVDRWYSVFDIRLKSEMRLKFSGIDVESGLPVANNEKGEPFTVNLLDRLEEQVKAIVKPLANREAIN